MATFPERALAGVNGALTWLFDRVLAPLVGVAPLTTLLIVSVTAGGAMLWVVARTSNQAGMAAAKRGIHAALFEIRLFNDDIGSVFRALGSALSQNARYVRFALVPLAWMLLPLVLLIAQLQAFYGYDGIMPGEPVLVKAMLGGDGPSAAASAPTLVAPDGIRVETDAVPLSGSPEVLWRIVPTRPGEFTLRVRTGGSGEATKSLRAGHGAARRSPLRVGSGLLDLLLYPSEPLAPAESGVASLAVRYPEPGLHILGMRIHWLIVFFVVSMASALILAKRFGITV